MAYGSYPVSVSPSSGGKGKIILLIVIVVGMLVAASYIFYVMYKNPGIIKKKSQVPDNNHFIGVKVLDSVSGEEVGLNYQIFNKGELVKEGVYTPSVQERFGQLLNTSVIEVKVLGEERYYDNKRSCPLDSECAITVQKKGKIFFSVSKLSDKFGLISILSQGGIIKNPKICMGWKDIDTISLSLPFEEANIPITRTWQFDKCYILNSSITGLFQSNITITPLQEFSPFASFNTILIDGCFENCIDEISVNTKLY